DILSISDGAIRQWTRAGKPVGKPLDYEGGIVGIMAVSPGGLMVVGACGDGRVRLCNIKEGSLVGQPWEGNHDRVICLDCWVASLCWSKDGEYIFSASLDCTIRKRQSNDGKELVVIRGHTEPVASLCLSPDGCHLVSASIDYSVPIWDLET
ncbi:hypothetical protein CY34DRAFT_58483, partial [Suillus luteus UH-Slu-Lm8-n1]